MGSRDDLPAPVDRRHLQREERQGEAWGSVRRQAAPPFVPEVSQGVTCSGSRGRGGVRRWRRGPCASSLRVCPRWPKASHRLERRDMHEEAKRRVLALHPVRRPKAGGRVVREIVNEAGSRHPAHLMGMWWAACGEARVVTAESPPVRSSHPSSAPARKRRPRRAPPCTGTGRPRRCRGRARSRRAAALGTRWCALPRPAAVRSVGRQRNAPSRANNCAELRAPAAVQTRSRTAGSQRERTSTTACCRSRAESGRRQRALRRGASQGAAGGGVPARSDSTASAG